jgi:hypothetical protein
MRAEVPLDKINNARLFIGAAKKMLNREHIFSDGFLVSSPDFSRVFEIIMALRNIAEAGQLEHAHDQERQGQPLVQLHGQDLHLVQHGRSDPDRPLLSQGQPLAQLEHHATRHDQLLVMINKGFVDQT